MSHFANNTSIHSITGKSDYKFEYTPFGNNKVKICFLNSDGKTKIVNFNWQNIVEEDFVSSSKNKNFYPKNKKNKKSENFRNYQS